MQNTRPKMQNTTMTSTKDEINGIEKSAQMMSSGVANNDVPPAASQRTLDSSCASMYIEDDSYYGSNFNDSADMSWQLSGASMDHTKNSIRSDPRRNSVLMSPAGMIGLEDIDSDDSDDDDDSGHAKVAPSSETGDPNHRPMVGGFAAAAYEAARADHYKKQQEKQKPPAP